jgi:phospholipid/cholesterol/gamma-HCH transport system substrate-binding protein
MSRKKKEHGLLVGIFIFLGLVILVIAIFTIGEKEGLFSENISISANFETIEGIRRGAPVRLSGVDVGIVTDILITKENKVNLSLRINKEFQKFIRKNAEASVELEGIVGVKYVAITYGTQDADIISNGDLIKSKEPFSLGKILQSAQTSVDNFEQLTKDFSSIINKVNRGKGTIGKLINDETMYSVLLSASEYVDTTVRSAALQLDQMSKSYLKLTNSIDRIVSGVDSTVYNINNIVNKIKYGEGTVWALFTRQDIYDSLLAMINNSIETVREAKMGASRFAENMEALKHNFFFKGYFEDRGYWDKAEFEKTLDQKIEYMKKKEEELNKKEKELIKKEEEIKNKKPVGN